MPKSLKPALVFNCVGFTRKPIKDDPSRYTDPEGQSKTKKIYHRYKRRLYLEDIESIEEYFYNEFKNFTTSPLTNIYTYSGDYVTVELAFATVEKILDRFDQQRTLIINN